MKELGLTRVSQFFIDLGHDFIKLLMRHKKDFDNWEMRCFVAWENLLFMKGLKAICREIGAEVGGWAEILQ